MAIYDTKYGLTQPEVNYLNQGLPSISGIFSNTPTTTSTNNTTSQTNNSVGLTPEQLALLFPQYNFGNNGGDGGGPPPGPPKDEEGYQGITGFDELGNPISNYTSPMNAFKNIGSFMLNPMGYLGYQGYKEYQDAKAKKELQDFYNTTQAKTAQDMARDNKASITGGYQYGTQGGGGGAGSDFMDGPSGAGRGNAPDDKGGSDSMGSFARGGRVNYQYGGITDLI